MLQWIISIRNVGRFRNCAAMGDVTFRRYTLIFGENARGKTTLCDILRSLFTNTPAIVIGRATLGSPDAPEIQFLTAVGPIGFRNGAWTAAYPDIAVFDGTYVRENVFAGDAVDTEHRRNLYRVIIGAQGVTLAATLDGLDNQIRGKTTEMRDNRAQMQRHMPQGMTPEVFIALAEDPELDAKIAAKEQELQATRQAAQLRQAAIAAVLVHHDVARTGVEADNADVEVLVVIAEAHFGPLGSGFSFIWLLLNQIRRRFYLLPSRLVD